MNSFYKVSEIKSDTLVVSFAGHDIMYGGIPRFEFVNFFAKYFREINQHYYIDKHKTSYHKGIDGISKNIDETVEYLRNEIYNYEKVVFLGVSSGGYAAILFGSLLGIDHVVAFIPQTIRFNKNIDEKYRDISKYINNITQYHLYGDLSVTNKSDCHHISHCERISNHPNVFINRVERFNLKQMRDSGELFALLNDIIHD